LMEDNCRQYEELDWLFRRMVRKFVKERDKIAVEGIPLPAMLILHKINRDGEQKLGDLAEQLDFSPGAITMLCDKLEKKGYAVRRRLPEDRRAVALGITQEGRRLLARQHGLSRESNQLLFFKFTQQELAVLKKAFIRITDNLAGYADAILRTAKANEARREEGAVDTAAAQADKKPVSALLNLCKERSIWDTRPSIRRERPSICRRKRGAATRSPRRVSPREGRSGRCGCHVSVWKPGDDVHAGKRVRRVL